MGHLVREKETDKKKSGRMNGEEGGDERKVIGKRRG